MTKSMLLSVLFSMILALFVQASPFPAPTAYARGLLDTSLAFQQRTTEPVFPDSPPSCPICQKASSSPFGIGTLRFDRAISEFWSYSSINSCAQAAPVLANFSMIILNPSAFISVIECSCTETFQSVFPQCVDCFEQTNQTDVLNAPDLPSVLSGMRNICALESTLLGGVASADGEIPSSSSSVAPSPTASSNSGSRNVEVTLFTMYWAMSLVVGGGLSSLLL